jgi:ABC-type multidrug transport system fused ATPase/permease subunit
MADKFMVSLLIIVLLLAEVILPIILMLILGFFVWRLIRKKWVNKIFTSLVYKKNPYVKEFYEQVGHSAEEKGNKFAKPLAYVALFLCIAIIFKILWSYGFFQSATPNLSLTDELPQMVLYVGLIFIGLGVAASVISSFIFIRETRKFKVYNRSIEIYLLGKYFEHIVYMTLGIALIIGAVYLWFFLLEKLVPAFSYLENQSASFGELKVNFEEMLKILRILLMSFRDQFQTWCITSFLISLAILTIPYLWFKGRRFTKIFLALFFLGTVFSYLVSFLIQTFIISELTLIYVAVWTFSALITSMVFHLINTIWSNKISICKHCRTENSIHSKYCGECGKIFVRR